MSKNAVPSQANHGGPGPKPEWTGGSHPRGHEVSPAKRRDAFSKEKEDGLGAARQIAGSSVSGVNLTKGYTVLSPSPVSGAEEYGRLTRGPREYRGIDVDEDLDGSYTGGGRVGYADSEPGHKERS